MSTEINKNNVTWTVREEIGFLSLDNPPENYLETPEFIPLDLLKDFIGTNPLRGMVICGVGRHFSAGAKLDNLYELSADAEVLKIKMGQGQHLLSYIENIDIPVIAAIKGICFGGGLEIALASHIRICSANALFAFPEVNHGMMPGLGGTMRSLQISRFPEVLKMILSGDIVNAEEAVEMNLVDKITPADPVEEAFLLLKKMTTDKPLKVIQSVMQAVRNSKALPPAEALKEETRLFCELAAAIAIQRSSGSANGNE